MSRRPIIGYTLGDQAGVGPEVVEAALCGLCPQSAHYVLLGERINCTLGVPSAATARAAWDHLELAASCLKEGSIDAVVTAPICKEGLHDLGFDYPGQTEFFADRLGVRDFAMCLTGKHLTVALATTHVALRDVPALLSAEELARVARLLADFLLRGKSDLHLALAGLNPHNGEHGAFGDEESRIILPALRLLQASAPASLRYSGPVVPDVVYRDMMMGHYDGIVAPYHDQALIPLKLLDFDNAVNVTLGLPRLRMSPDHGTAFSIAGKGIASSASTRHAFELALRTVR